MPVFEAQNLSPKSHRHIRSIFPHFPLLHYPSKAALGCFDVQTSPFLGTRHEEENFSENFTDYRKEVLVYEESWLENHNFNNVLKLKLGKGLP